jgi:hypothetical protein
VASAPTDGYNQWQQQQKKKEKQWKTNANVLHSIIIIEIVLSFYPS